jgi:hypothetical protein
VAANLASGPVICPAVASSKRPKPPKPTEADLQARLDAARMRVREIVMLRMKSWLSQEARDGLLDAEDWRRDRVNRILEDFREEQRRRRAERHFTR